MTPATGYVKSQLARLRLRPKDQETKRPRDLTIKNTCTKNSFGCGRVPR